MEARDAPPTTPTVANIVALASMRSRSGAASSMSAMTGLSAADAGSASRYAYQVPSAIVSRRSTHAMSKPAVPWSLASSPRWTAIFFTAPNATWQARGMSRVTRATTSAADVGRHAAKHSRVDHRRSAAFAGAVGASSCI